LFFGIAIIEEPGKSESFRRIQASNRSKEVKPIRVVVIGGGFAAVQFAKTLRSKLRASECEILLFNRKSRHSPLRRFLAPFAVKQGHARGRVASISPRSASPQLLSKETAFAGAIKVLNANAAGQLLILDERQCLWGTLDRQDPYQSQLNYTQANDEIIHAMGRTLE